MGKESENFRTLDKYVRLCEGKTINKVGDARHVIPIVNAHFGCFPVPQGIIAYKYSCCIVEIFISCLKGEKRYSVNCSSNAAFRRTYQCN